jgi:hypothetical protein
VKLEVSGAALTFDEVPVRILGKEENLVAWVLADVDV